MVRKELRQIFRDPRMARMIFVAPIIQLLVFGYAVSTDVRTRADPRRRPRPDRRPRASWSTPSTASGYFRVVGRSDRAGATSSAPSTTAAPCSALVDPAGLRARPAPPGGRQRCSCCSTAPTRTWPRWRAATPSGSCRAAALRRSPGVRPPAGDRPARARLVQPRPAPAATTTCRRSSARSCCSICLLLTALAVVREREIGTLEQLMVSPLRPRRADRSARPSRSR